MSCPFRRYPVSIWSKLRRFFSLPSDRHDGVDGVLSAENLQAVLDTTVDSIITINEESEIIAFNKIAERMFGYAKDEVLRKNVKILMPEPYHSQHDTYVQNYLKTGNKKIIGIGREVAAKRKDGTIFPIDLAVSEVITQSGRLFTAIIRDITEKKREEATARAAFRMEAELRGKSEYVSIISHELRTPLSSMYASLGLLMLDGDLSGKKGELISIAYRTTKRLLGLVNDVLDNEKIQSGKIVFNLAPTPVSEIAEEAIADAQPMAKQLGITLIAENRAPNVQIVTDKNRIIQVLLNFLSNAIKFSKEGTQVAIRWEISGEKVRVSVHNLGAGIPSEHQEKIFTLFFQVPNNGARISGGVGLGLYLCKSIVEQLGGEIGFHSEVNGETVFYFAFPIYEEK